MIGQVSLINPGKTPYLMYAFSIDRRLWGLSGGLAVFFRSSPVWIFQYRLKRSRRFPTCRILTFSTKLRFINADNHNALNTNHSKRFHCHLIVLEW